MVANYLLNMIDFEELVFMFVLLPLMTYSENIFFVALLNLISVRSTVPNRLRFH